jgi:hypothetical protein
MSFENNIKKGAESSLQAIKDGTNVVVSEVGKILKISEKKIDINSLKKKIEKNFSTLGELVYRYLTDGITNPLDQPDVREVLQNIYQYNDNIRQMENEIEIIKNINPAESVNNKETDDTSESAADISGKASSSNEKSEKATQGDKMEDTHGT